MKRLFLFILVLVSPGCASNDSLYNIQPGHYGKSVVSEKTHSMYPTYIGGETVIVFKEQFNKIKTGDIIIYRNYINYKVDYVIHRVIWRDSDALICKGDNNNYIDENPIFECDYIGTAVGVKY